MTSLPNILFILCDDLGINDLHCYGREDHNTPNLDRLAEAGTRFTSSYASQAICSASRAGLLTGLNPARLHLTTYLPGRPDAASQRLLHPEIMMHIPLSIRTWPQYFKDVGYVTGLIGKWHVGKQPGPAEHGFDFVYHPGESKNTVPSETEGGKAEFELTRETIRFMDSNKDRPFVAYLGHYTPHIPYTARHDLIEKNADAFEPVYAAVVESLDDTVGMLMDALDSMNLAADTILVFTSDNGGLHVPEGHHERVTHNTPFRAGKGYVYEGGSRVPLIVRWPGRVSENRVIDTPVNNIDWIPTLLEMIGKDVPEGLDGVSFADGLLGGEVSERTLYWHFPHYTNQGGRPSGAMRDGDWLYVEPYDDETVELYDLSTDIGERTNVADQHPDRIASMRDSLDQWRTNINAQINTPNENCDEGEFRELYVDFDPSKFDPLTATEEEWAQIQKWREGMNKVYRKN